jgi:hypothetical protein
VECVRNITPECLTDGIPPLLMGVRGCAAGQWGDCVVNETCDNLRDACPNGAMFPTEWSCLDGSARSGYYGCGKIFGAQCMSSYYGNWPVKDCPGDLCLGPGDACLTKDEERPCEVRCDSPQGAVKPGMQSCVEYCGPGNLAWGPCLTFTGSPAQEACLNP